MATDYDAFNFSCICTKSVAEEVFETCAVKSTTHTDDTVFGKTAHLVDKVSHGVHGVRDADDDSVGRIFEKLVGN